MTILFGPLLVKAQYFKARHIPGDMAGAFLFRYSPDGFGAELMKTCFRSRGFSYSLLFSPFSGKIDATNFIHLKVGFRPQKELFDINKDFFFSGFLSGYSGFEDFDNSSLDMKYRKLFFSLGIRSEAEYYFNDKISFISTFQQEFNISSKMGDQRFSAALGLRYIF